MKKREQQMQDLEIRKKKIEEDLKINNIENKFATHYDAVEQQLKVNADTGSPKIFFSQAFTP